MAARKPRRSPKLKRAPKPKDGLNEKQRRFVEEYLNDPNATQAAIRAGYEPRTARVTGPRLLQNVAVSRALEVAREARSARAQCTADWVLEGLRAVYQRCMTEVKPVLDMRGDPTGEFAFDSKGANKSLELVGKHLGMFVERRELTGKGGAPLEALVNLNPEQRRERMAQLLAKKERPAK